MTYAYLVLVTLDGKFQDMEIANSHEKADEYRQRVNHEIRELQEMGDPGTWEVFLSEIKEHVISVPKDRMKAEVDLHLPELKHQYEDMLASYREVNRWALFEKRKQEVVRYLRDLERDKRALRKEDAESGL